MVSPLQYLAPQLHNLLIINKTTFIRNKGSVSAGEAADYWR